ncbi:MAG: DUF4296 domain-containing protein [Flavobacterium sp.]|nr:DUF4296 domain-containing protein [Flavobacterium sp.]
MKKIILILLAIITITACKKEVIKPPKNLLEKEVLVNIIYDLSLLEAAKTQSMGVQYSYPKASEFIKSKYKIDSITFADNIQYYSQDAKEFKKIYITVKERLDNKTKELNGGKIPPPDTSQGILK